MAAIHLHFGLQYDHVVAPRGAREAGMLYAGPRRLLHWLERYLGLDGHEDDNRHLRIAVWRRLLDRYVSNRPAVFFAASFRTDPLATAADLLDRRDELVDAGWSFLAEAGMPERLRVLAELEQHQRQDAALGLPAGMTDRLRQVCDLLDQEGPQAFASIHLAEPLELLSPGWRRLFARWSDRLVADALPRHAADTDLGHLQARLLGHTPVDARVPARGDGTLLVWRSRYARDAAAFLAALMRHNDHFRPLMVVTADDRTLDTALAREGFPGMGIPSSSLARPPLQLLKLAQAFLWEPVQIDRILEFVSLPVKPLDDELAHHIARHLSRRPGIEGPEWQAAIGAFFRETETKRPHLLDDIRRAYQFWFERRRYPMEEGAPLGEVRRLYAHIERWALNALRQQANRYPSLFLLASQARKVGELLEMWPRHYITALELERLVRTIFEPAPASFEPEEAGHLPWVSAPGALTGPTDEVCWWNFIEFEPTWFFDLWTPQERAWLRRSGAEPLSPLQLNARHICHRNRPVLMARRRLVLIIPDEVDGREAMPYPLWSEVAAAFTDTAPLTVRLDEPDTCEQVLRDAGFRLPEYVTIAPAPLPRPEPRVHFRPVCPPRREVESLSSLEALFYYPHIWLFRHWLGLEDTPLFQVVNEATLTGNLAHRVFEYLLSEADVLHWNRAQLEHWLEATLDRLVRQEGVVLLQFGRESERVALRRTLARAAWRLLDMIRRDGWQVKATEQHLEGPFADIRVRGIADLVLERGDELAIIDLKWGGKAHRADLIRNEADIQLTCYAHLACNGQGFAHTAYFIIKQGVMLARTDAAFSEAQTFGGSQPAEEVQQTIWHRMEQTWRWRMTQLQNGMLEVRTSRTKEALDRTADAYLYGFDPFDLFEMKADDHPFDEYKVLLGLVE